jgi:NAD(P)-dependent dehydrogenase (short-subunit alcohol dehydrogenase family)
MSTTAESVKKRALLTGGAGVIGRAIAEGLLRHGMEVILTVREARKGELVRSALTASTGQSPRIEMCDLSRKTEIEALADRVGGALYVLINNAAECPRRRTETREGIERQLATNVLGYYWMMQAFKPHLEAGAPSRIVNVASYWAGGLDVRDLEFKTRSYDNDAAYRQSKQADRMISRYFAERYREAGITVNACHPGDVRSKLSSDLGFGGHESPGEGAATPLMLATDEIGGQVTGGYFAHFQEEHCRFSRDAALTKSLIEALGAYG